MSSKPATLYQSWFCPFAQRAWIGVLHRKLDLEIKEVDPYDKSREWLAINPRGLVPALIHEGHSIYESTILLEYLDEAWPEHDGPTVLPPPSEYYQRFQARIWGDHINNKLIPPIFRIVKEKNAEERTKATTEFLEKLKYMFDQKTSNTRFYMDDKPGYVDFLLVPFAFVCEVIVKHFRGLTIPQEGYEKYHEWYKHVMELECVRLTLADKKKLIQRYERYQ